MILGSASSRASGRVAEQVIASVRGMYFHFSVVLYNLL
jgi:hypothetical protein